MAVPDLEAAAASYRNTLGAKVSAPQDEPDHGVTVVFVELPNTKIELLYPLGEGSPIAKFLGRTRRAACVCYEVDDIRGARPACRPRAPGSWATASRGLAPTTSRCCSSIPRISAAP